MRGKQNIQKRRQYTGRMRKQAYRANLQAQGVRVDMWDSRVSIAPKTPQIENTDVLRIDWWKKVVIHRIAKERAA
jgi:hypothetical protein